MTSCTDCATLARRIEELSVNPMLGMYNQAGGIAATQRLPAGNYTVVFCDINRLKALNTATGNHMQTNRYLASGLKVRSGEIAMQFLGDEFVFIIQGDAAPFVRRLAAQLAAQPLTWAERCALAVADGVSPETARLSATFASRVHVPTGELLQAIEACSIEVLATKAQRPRA